jgi:hypothetical protein
MRPYTRRLKALILTAALLIGGSGASALDLALYHLGGHTEASQQRVAGTDAPRPHGDNCVLLDWTARGPYTAGPSPVLLELVAPQLDRPLSLRVLPPRPTDRSGDSLPRAPPVPLA